MVHVDFIVSLLGVLVDSFISGEEEEVSAEAEESLGDANVDALIAAVDETHFKMFRLNELESEQHQMVMALRSTLTLNLDLIFAPVATLTPNIKHYLSH